MHVSWEKGEDIEIILITPLKNEGLHLYVHLAGGNRSTIPSPLLLAFREEITRELFFHIRFTVIYVARSGG